MTLTVTLSQQSWQTDDMHKAAACQRHSVETMWPLNHIYVVSGLVEPVYIYGGCRRGIALAHLNGPIYAVGGLDDTACFNIVERYDAESDCWTIVQSMNSARGGVAVTAFRVRSHLTHTLRLHSHFIHSRCVHTLHTDTVACTNLVIFNGNSPQDHSVYNCCHSSASQH